MARRKTKSNSRTRDFDPPAPSARWNGNTRPADVYLYLEGTTERKLCVICARELRKEGTVLEVQRAASGWCERCTNEITDMPTAPATMEEILAKAEPLVRDIGVGNVEQLKLF